jgi:hypothetical protein
MTSRHPSLPPIKPAGGQSGISPAQPTAFSVDVASRFGGRSRLTGPRYPLLWQTVAIAASMLIFASLRPSTTDVTAGDTKRSPMLNFGSKGLGRTVSGERPKQVGVSRTEAQLRRSDYFVAKDFTNHFNLHAQSIATVGKSELTPTAHDSVSQKHVVLN